MKRSHSGQAEKRDSKLSPYTYWNYLLVSIASPPMRPHIELRGRNFMLHWAVLESLIDPECCRSRARKQTFHVATYEEGGKLVVWEANKNFSILIFINLLASFLCHLLSWGTNILAWAPGGMFASLWWIIQMQSRWCKKQTSSYTKQTSKANFNRYLYWNCLSNY